MKKNKLKKFIQEEVAKELAALDSANEKRIKWEAALSGISGIITGNMPSILTAIQEANIMKQRNIHSQRMKSSQFHKTGQTAKEEFNEQTVNPDSPDKLEVGKWYKHIDKVRRLLFCFTGEYDSHKDPIGYGFVEDNWTYSKAIGWTDVNVPAEIEEVEQALVVEAIKRGFKIGARYINARFEDCEEYIESDTIEFIPNTNTLCLDGNTVFHDGSWGKILLFDSKQETPQTKIDWFNIRKGFLVEDDEVVIMLSGRTTSNHFEGTVIKIKKPEDSFVNYHLGFTLSNILKNGFIPFTGQLTLKN